MSGSAFGFECQGAPEVRDRSLIFNVAAAFVELTADKIDLLRTQILRLPFPNDFWHHFMTSDAEVANDTFGDIPAWQSQNRLWINVQPGTAMDEFP